MKPTIGRIVHYQHEGQLLPAIITNIVGENLVNLQIFKDGLGSCYFHEGVEFGEEEGQWSWPKIESPASSTSSTMPNTTNKP